MKEGILASFGLGGHPERWTSYYHLLKGRTTSQPKSPPHNWRLFMSMQIYSEWKFPLSNGGPDTNDEFIWSDKW